MYKSLTAILAVANAANLLELELDNAVANSAFGVDVSQAMSLSTAQCLKSYGYSWVVPRGWCSYGAVDTSVCTTLKNAQSAGITTRDVYMFPCPTCSASAASQISSLVSYLQNNCNSAWTKKIWLDIEGSQYWTGSTTANRSWYQALKDACVSHTGVTCGIYSSYYQWEAIFGSTGYSYGSNLDLWYAHYDNYKGFDDFQSFGSWTYPRVKQYVGDTTLCSMGVDLDLVR